MSDGDRPMSEDRAVELLQGIWGEMKTLNGRVNRLGDRLDRGLGELREELSGRLEAGFGMMDRRFDQLLLGEHGQEHQQFRKRLDRLEAHSGLQPLE